MILEIWFWIFLVLAAALVIVPFLRPGKTPTWEPHALSVVFILLLLILGVERFGSAVK